MRSRAPGLPGRVGGKAAPGPSLLDRWLVVRDRLLASPRFQAWAAAFPPTRPVARRRARALFDLCAGFVYAQVLHACVRLRLFEILAEGPQTVGALAERLDLSRDAAARLLGAAASLRLAERRSGGRFGLGDLGAAALGNPAVAAMVEHHATLYADLRDPVALLRGEAGPTGLARYWPYAGGGDPAGLQPEQVAPYTALMAASQALVAGAVLDAYPLGRHRCLLDLGGGDGSFLVAAAARAPHLRLVLLDLPAVAERARARFAAAGLADRATAVGGSFLTDAPPEGPTSSRWSAWSTTTTTRRRWPSCAPRAARCRPAAPCCWPSRWPGRPGPSAYFAFYLLAMGSGRPRTPDELGRLLRAAGFGRYRLVPTRQPLLTRLIVAQA